MQILIIVIIVWMIVSAQKKKKGESSTRRTSGRTVSGSMSSQTFSKKKQASAVPNVPKKKHASAVPNMPKKLKRTKEESAMEARTRASARACHYEAAYSKGKPGRIGGRGDYETSTPQGMSRIRCAYCGAENFVPAGTHEHYHCYFCWEKL